MTMCFKDMTFCSSDCTNRLCFRNYTPKVKEDAEKWWGKEGAPIAFSDFSPNCDEYIPKRDKT